MGYFHQNQPNACPHHSSDHINLNASLPPLYATLYMLNSTSLQQRENIMFPGGGISPTAETETCLYGADVKCYHPMTNMTRRKRSKNKTKIRFSDEQIRSLESTFETESRPEQRLKQKLANQLGLQPRQVAIWFQNKRARSKSKQIEQDYSLLKTDYDTLASRLESLKKENQSLIIQLQRLRNVMGSTQQTKRAVISAEGGNEEYDENHNFLLKPCSHETGMLFCDDETDILKMAEPIENRCSFETSDNSSCAQQWWEF